MPVYPHYAFYIHAGRSYVLPTWSSRDRAVVIGRDADAVAAGEPVKVIQWRPTVEAAVAEAAYQTVQRGGEWWGVPVTYLEEQGPRFHVRSPRGVVHALTAGRRYRMGGRTYRNSRALVAGRADCHVDTSVNAEHTLDAVTCPRCLAHAAHLEASLPTQ